MSDNKITLFHLLSATAANQNGKQQEGNTNDNYQDEVAVLPYTEAEEQDFTELEETPDIAALFEEGEAQQSAPYPVPAQVDEVILLPADELDILTAEKPSWEDSREQASMRVFASNKENQTTEVVPPIELITEEPIDALVDFQEEEIIEKDTVLEEAVSDVQAIVVVVENSREEDTFLNASVAIMKEEVEENIPTAESFIVPVALEEIPAENEGEAIAETALDTEEIESEAIIDFAMKTEETEGLSIENMKPIAIENEADAIAETALDAEELNSEVDIDFARETEEPEALPIENIEAIAIEKGEEIEMLSDIEEEVMETPTLETIETEETAEEDAPNIEYLDTPEDFSTEDIDEAYRQRLVALGLEPIETATEEATATPISATENTEDVDEALSQVFANPEAKLNPAILAPIEAIAKTEEQEINEAETAGEAHFSPLDFQLDEETNTEANPAPSLTREVDDKASMLQQFRQLQDRNSTFVFMFGRQQAGKTVVLSSLAYHMGIDEHGLLETRRRVDNLKGAAYLKQLSESVRKGQFMNRTAVGSLYELDLTYTPNNPEVPMNFTFLEMSGEDLTKVELDESSAGDLPSDIEVYLKCPNINVVFMIVVPYEDAEEHDYLVIDFLDYIKERKPDFDYSKLLLLVSKWDRYDGLRKDEVDLFVKEQMPRTYSRLKAKKATLARYSVGEVSDNNEEILELNQERPEVVKRWLYQAGTGQKIKEEGNSFWNKIKSWM